MIRSLLIVLSALFMTAGMAAGAGSGDAAGAMRVSDAWVRAGPPGMAVLAGYMRLTNTGDKELAVTNVTSPDFAMVEMHRTVVSDGVARMQSQEQLLVPSGGELSMAPGGLHLMLMHPKRTLESGDNITLTLHIRDHDPITLNIPVKTKP